MSIDRGSLAAMVSGLPDVDFVVRMAACGFDVTIEEMTSEDRSHPIVSYRMVTMAAVRQLTGASFPAIGRRFDRDHTTVMHACERCRKVPELRRALDALCFEVRRQWAVDHGLDAPMRGQEVLAL